MTDIIPCPFCHGECGRLNDGGLHGVMCHAHEGWGCGYISALYETEAEAIAAHNRVAGAVELVREISCHSANEIMARADTLLGQARAIMEES
jgi:hypothetical protein